MKPLEQKNDLPSMQEILESIRGVINEDGENFSLEKEKNEEDVLELTDIVNENNVNSAATAAVIANMEEGKLPSSSPRETLNDTALIDQKKESSIPGLISPEIPVTNLNTAKEMGAPLEENKIDNKEVPTLADKIPEVPPEIPLGATPQNINNENLVSQSVAEETTTVIQDLINKTSIILV